MLIAVSPEIYALIAIADGVTFNRNSHTEQCRARWGVQHGSFCQVTCSYSGTPLHWKHFLFKWKLSSWRCVIFLRINVFTYAFFLLIDFMGNCPNCCPASVVAHVCLHASNTLGVRSWSCTVTGESGSRGLQLCSKYMITSCNTDLWNRIAKHLFASACLLLVEGKSAVKEQIWSCQECQNKSLHPSGLY